jgi:hypothetical protein
VRGALGAGGAGGVGAALAGAWALGEAGALVLAGLARGRGGGRLVPGERLEGGGELDAEARLGVLGAADARGEGCVVAAQHSVSTAHASASNNTLALLINTHWLTEQLPAALARHARSVERHGLEALDAGSQRPGAPLLPLERLGGVGLGVAGLLVLLRGALELLWWCAVSA